MFVVRAGAVGRNEKFLCRLTQLAVTKEKPNAKIEPGVWQLKSKLLYQRDLRGFDNFSGFYAACAYFDPAVAAGRQLNTDGLKIRIEPAPGLIIRV